MLKKILAGKIRKTNVPALKGSGMKSPKFGAYTSLPAQQARA